MFVSSDKCRLADLRATVDLLTSIAFFRLKVQEQTSPPRAADIVKECVSNCFVATYKFMVEHCNEVYQRDFQVLYFLTRVDF